VRVVFLLADGAQTAIDFALAPGGTPVAGTRGGDEVGRAAFANVVELAIPFAALGVAPGARVAFAVHALRGEVEAERLPRHGFVTFSVPDADFEGRHWRV
jgi:hypothetical protein